MAKSDLPIVDNGKPIGSVSLRNALDPDLEEFLSESSRRAQILMELKHECFLFKIYEF